MRAHPANEEGKASARGYSGLGVARARTCWLTCESSGLRECSNLPAHENQTRQDGMATRRLKLSTVLDGLRSTASERAGARTSTPTGAGPTLRAAPSCRIASAAHHMHVDFIIEPSSSDPSPTNPFVTVVRAAARGRRRICLGRGLALLRRGRLWSDLDLRHDQGPGLSRSRYGRGDAPGGAFCTER